jgi:hypothetical protein
MHPPSKVVMGTSGEAFKILAGEFNSLLRADIGQLPGDFAFVP